METKIYITDINLLENEKIYIKEYNKLSFFRRQKADKLKTSISKKQSVCAGMLLRYALNNLGINEKNISYNLNEFGKPYLAGENIFFNISHSDRIVMCAVSDIEIGCDVEKMREVNLKIADKFFDDKEKEFVEQFSNAEKKKEAFFEIWTKKESFLKCSGKGINIPLKSFSVTENPICCFGETFYLESIALNNMYKSALCVKGEKRNFEIIEVEFDEYK